MILKEKLIECGFIDNEFMDKYIDLLNEYKNDKKIKFKTQGHHAIPVCWYGLKYNIEERKGAEKIADADLDNFKVHLSFANHILAHYYLALFSIGEIKHKLDNGFFHLVNCEYETEDFDPKNDLEKYDNIYKEFLIEKSKRMLGKSSYFKSKKHSDESKEKNRKKHLGKHYSPETEIKKGEHKSPKTEFKKGEQSSFKGHHWDEKHKQHLREIRIGTQLSEEVKLKIREATKTRKPILQFNLNGSFIREWSCAKEIKKRIRCFG